MVVVVAIVVDVLLGDGVPVVVVSVLVVGFGVIDVVTRVLVLVVVVAIYFITHAAPEGTQKF